MPDTLFPTGGCPRNTNPFIDLLRCLSGAGLGNQFKLRGVLPVECQLWLAALVSGGGHSCGVSLRFWIGGWGALMNRRHAATHVALYGRARHRAVRAEHAAIAREGLEPFATALAVIEELAGIGRHRLDSLIAAFGASECGLKLHTGSCFSVSIPRLAAGSFRH